MSELIGPETNLYGKTREGRHSLADVGQMPSIHVIRQEQAPSAETVLDLNEAVMLDYGGAVEGLLFTFKPIK